MTAILNFLHDQKTSVFIAAVLGAVTARLQGTLNTPGLVSTLIALILPSVFGKPK
jgi:hypothetical protein